MTTTYPARLPANPLTPQGAYYALKGIHPRVCLLSWDGTQVFDLMGGSAIADRFTSPECVQLASPPKGLIANWTMIDQQGANEDGVTWVASANEPLEIDLPIRCVARDGKHLREVVRTLLAAIDTKKQSTLSFWTPELGYWSTKVRWFKAPPDGFKIGGQHKSLDLTLRLRGDTGFWQGLPDVSEFRFAYDDVKDDFSTDYEEGFGANWPILLTGKGGGYPYVNKGAARWRDDPRRTFLTSSRTFVAGPYKDFSTETDYQVAEIVLDSFVEIGAAQDIWLRHGRQSDGAWNGYGARARITNSAITVSAFVNYHETVVAWWPLFLPPPLPLETFRFEMGDPDNLDPYAFKVKRGFSEAGVTSLSWRDDSAVIPLGAAFRGVGFGGYASGAIITQGTPAAVTRFSAGDSSGAEQSGFIERINIGTVDRWDTYTCYGPGTFNIAAGPGSTDMVQFGPLLPNQIVRINSDHSKRVITDLTSTPPTAAELLEYRDALAELESFAPIGNIGPTVNANASGFGITPPQGNMNRLLDGRFSRPIPPKPVAGPATTTHVAVSISGGNSASRVIASGVPRRRYPQ